MSKPLTPEDVKEQAREYLKLTQTNVVKLAGTVISNFQSEPKPRMQNNVQMVDANGNLLFYAPRSSIKVSFMGGEIEVPVTSDQFNTTPLNSTCLFTGRLGLVKSFGSESITYIFDTIEEL